MDCTCFLDLFFDKNLATRYFCLAVIVEIYFLTSFFRNLFAAKMPPKIATADVGSKSKGTGVGALLNVVWREDVAQSLGLLPSRGRSPPNAYPPKDS